MKRQIFTIAMAWLAIAAQYSCAEREREFDACGQIEVTEVIVSAENSGKITDFAIEEGDLLKNGQNVGTIDSVQTYLKMEELIRRREEAETKLVDIKTQLSAKEANLDKLEQDYKRYSTLAAKDAGTQKQVDDAASQLAVARNELKAQKQTYEKNNSSINETMKIYDVQIAQQADQLAKCRIISPVDGTVLTKYAEQGEMVTTGKPLFKIADMRNTYVKAYFTTDQLASVKLGDTVTVIPEDGTDNPKEYEGRVTWISDEAEFTPKNIQTKDERADLVYATKVTVKNDGYLKLGMYAYVRLRK